MSDSSERREPKADNLFWSKGTIDQTAREQLLGQRGCVLWFTGLSGSGKSTLASHVEGMLAERGIATYLLDGDNLRHGLNSDLAFSAEDRNENIRRMGEVAALFADAGIVTLVTAISPYEAGRRAARAAVKSGAFLEIHLNVALDVCESRDPKGLYARARAGEIADFTGISAPYEAPARADLALDTGGADAATCARQILDLMESRGLLRRSDGQDH